MELRGEFPNRKVNLRKKITCTICSIYSNMVTVPTSMFPLEVNIWRCKIFLFFGCVKSPGWWKKILHLRLVPKTFVPRSTTKWVSLHRWSGDVRPVDSIWRPQKTCCFCGFTPHFFTQLLCMVGLDAPYSWDHSWLLLEKIHLSHGESGVFIQMWIMILELPLSSCS